MSALHLAGTGAPIIKQCACGRSYTATTWRWLRKVGLMDDGAGGILELRDCVCRSTVALALPAHVVLQLVTAEDRSRAIDDAEAYSEANRLRREARDRASLRVAKLLALAVMAAILLGAVS